jgi:hypothetical protein
MSGEWSRTAIRLLGVGFIAMVIGAVVLTVALYEKAFTPVVPVTLQLTELPDQFEESSLTSAPSSPSPSVTGWSRCASDSTRRSWI